MTTSNPKAHVVDYASAEAFLNGREGRKLENNTYVHRIGQDLIALRLHYTNVVYYYRDGVTTLHTGGFYSATTKDRLNKYSRASVFQRRGQWIVNGEHDFTEGIRDTVGS